VPALVYDFTLSADTPARAAEVQANFDAIKALLNGTKLGQDNIQANAIVAGLIATGAVTTAKIGDSQVTNAKMADSSVDTAELVDASVTAPKVAAGAVTSPKLDLTVLEDALAADVNPVGVTFVDLCSVAVTTGTYLVNGQVSLDDNGGSRHIHTSLFYNGVDHESGDFDFSTPAVVPVTDIITVTSGTVLKLRVRDSSNPTSIVRARGWTTLKAVRIG
jgi:hypothetical protein